MDYLKEAKEFYKQAVKPYKGNPVGCSSRDLAELERQTGFPLPEAYRQFLLWMGRDNEGVFVGSDWFIDDVVDNTEFLPELLTDNNVDFRLPEHYLAFFSHQGYMAAWFNLPKESENPIVYFYSEGSGMNAPVLEGTFTDFLLKNMRGMASYL